MNEVTFGKDTAPGGYTWWAVFALESQTGKVVHANAEPISLLLDKSAGPSGA
ncbi:hypothetical protein ES703_68812 [subsurface metagenome]